MELKSNPRLEWTVDPSISVEAAPVLAAFKIRIWVITSFYKGSVSPLCQTNDNCGLPCPCTLNYYKISWVWEISRTGRKHFETPCIL